MCEIRPKLTIMTPEQRQWSLNDANDILISLLLTLNIFHTFSQFVYCILWTRKYLLRRNFSKNLWTWIFSKKATTRKTTWKMKININLITFSPNRSLALLVSLNKQKKTWLRILLNFKELILEAIPRIIFLHQFAMTLSGNSVFRTLSNIYDENWLRK